MKTGHHLTGWLIRGWLVRDRSIMGCPIGGSNRLVRSAVSAILAVGANHAGIANAAAAKHVDISAGDLSQALLRLSKQYGADLVYRPEQVHGLKTHGAHGEFTTEQAVTQSSFRARPWSFARIPVVQC